MTVEMTKCAACPKSVPRDPAFMYASEYYCAEHYKAKTGQDPHYGDSRQVSGAGRAPVVEQRYGATRAVVALLRIIAVLTVIASLWAAGSGEIAAPISFVVAGVLAGLVLFAAAEGLQVVLDMEEHQRAIRMQMEKAVQVLVQTASAP